MFYLYKWTHISTFHCVYWSLLFLPKHSRWFIIGQFLPQFCWVNWTDELDPRYLDVVSLCSIIGVLRSQYSAEELKYPPPSQTTFQLSPLSPSPSPWPNPVTSCWLLNGLLIPWVCKLFPVVTWVNRIICPHFTGVPASQTTSPWASLTCHNQLGVLLFCTAVTNCCPLPVFNWRSSLIR